MTTLARTTSGLLYQSDGSLTGWTNAGLWTSVSDPAFCIFDALPYINLGGSFPNNGAGSSGIRECQIYVEAGVWWLIFGSGDMVNGWQQKVTWSTDRGLTWAPTRPFSEGYTNHAGGNFAATDVGWLEKRGSTYYRHRVTTNAVGTFPDTGTPYQPYGWDVWTASSILGTWTWAATTTGGTSWGTTDFLGSCTVLSGGTYYNFADGTNAGFYSCGITTSSSPQGPYTIGTAIVDQSTTGLNTLGPENSKVFFSTSMSVWVCLVNLINLGNAIGISSSLTDWSAAVWKTTQIPSPMDGSPRPGIVCHMTGPDGALVGETSGYVPVIYDTGGNTLGSFGHNMVSGVLEPSPVKLHYAGAGDTTSRGLSRSLSHTDIIIECVAELTAVNGAAGSLTIEYRSDGSGTCYRARLGSGGGWSLYKVASGTETLRATGSGSQTFTVNYTFHRLKVQVIGNVHKAWLNGELQYTLTDSSAPIVSGTTLAINGKGFTGDVRCLSCRTSDTVTIAGMNATTSCIVRSHGALPAGAITSDSSGAGTFTHAHYPLAFLELDGTDYTPSGGIWGGDTLTFSGVPAAPVGGSARRAIGR